jgi:hypothetical protein
LGVCAAAANGLVCCLPGAELCGADAAPQQRCEAECLIIWVEFVLLRLLWSPQDQLCSAAVSADAPGVLQGCQQRRQLLLVDAVHPGAWWAHALDIYWDTALHCCSCCHHKALHFSGLLGFAGVEGLELTPALLHWCCG